MNDLKGLQHHDSLIQGALPAASNDSYLVSPQNYGKVASSSSQKPIASRKETRTCFYCTKPGHIASNCSLKKRDLPSGKVKPSAKYSAVDSALRHSEYLAANNPPNDVFSEKMRLNTMTVNHMFSSKDAFEFLTPCEPISIPVGRSSFVSSAKGSILLKMFSGGTMRLSDVYYTPDLGTNLISVQNVSKKLGKDLLFDSSSVSIDGVIIGSVDRGIYVFHGKWISLARL